MIQFSEVARSKTLAGMLDAGDKRIILTGDVVAMDEHRTVLRDGRICLEGSLIAAVVEVDNALPGGFDKAPRMASRAAADVWVESLWSQFPDFLAVRADSWLADRPLTLPQPSTEVRAQLRSGPLSSKRRCQIRVAALHCIGRQPRLGAYRPRPDSCDARGTRVRCRRERI